MNVPQFNAMLRSARDMLAKYHDGVAFDPETVRWAQELVAANPTDKRRPTPAFDEIDAAFSNPSAKTDGLTIKEMLDKHLIVGRSQEQLAKLVGALVVAGKLFSLREGRACRYFKTPEDRAAAKDRAPIESEPAMVIPRLAKTKPPRKARDAMTPARKAFNGGLNQPKARMAEKLMAGPTDAQKIPKALFPSKSTKRINPNQGMPWEKKPSAEQKAIIPPGMKIQKCPSYTHDPRVQCAPGEKPFGAGFSAAGPGRDICTGKVWGSA